MRILVNCSNLKIGGGIQVALSFIYESIKFNDNEYCIVAHENIYNQISISDFTNNYQFIKCNYKFGRRVKNFLNNIEKEYMPDIVFSIFGPTYWTPKSPHLMGFARGHVIYSNSLYRKRLRLKNRIFFDIKNKILLYYTKKNSKNFVVETQSAQQILRSLVGSSSKVYCVSNTYPAVYDTLSKWTNTDLPPKDNNEIRFVYICSNYPHKNIQILPKVISELKELDKTHKYKIILSINENELAISEEQKQHFIFLGKLDVNKCPMIYETADALLMPSLIETFSASYLEAMKMKCPILTSDIDFAHDICKEAAIYFNPLDPYDIAKKIHRFISNNRLRQSLINKGSNQLLKFPSAEKKAQQYFEICKQIVYKTTYSKV